VGGFRPDGGGPVVSVAETAASGRGGQGGAGDEGSLVPHGQLLVNSIIY
jgi:hypothetical protein